MFYIAGVWFFITDSNSLKFALTEWRFWTRLLSASIFLRPDSMPMLIFFKAEVRFFSFDYIIITTKCYE